MKPDTWGSIKHQSAAKIEENIYIPSSMSNMSCNNSFYTDRIPTSTPLYSNVSNNIGQTFTSLPTFNPHHYYQGQLPNHFEQSSMPFASQPQPSAPVTQTTVPFLSQHSVPYHSHSFAQPQMSYNPPPLPTQSFPQQQFYPSQSFQTQQSVYQPSIHQQLSQPPQTVPNQNSGLQHPSIYQCQNFSDPNRPIQQSLPALPVKFDPYRPQPVGAYDIPKVQQTTIPPPHMIDPQDIYRSGGLLGMNQTQIPPSSVNNNSYGQNQFVQYIPSASIPSSFANLSIN
jgi:hypothetical protein